MVPPTAAIDATPGFVDSQRAAAVTSSAMAVGFAPASATIWPRSPGPMSSVGAEMFEVKKMARSGGSVGAVGAAAPQPRDVTNPHTIAPRTAHAVSDCLESMAQGIIWNLVTYSA